MLDNDLAQRLVREKPWHQDFEIVPGVRTHGTYDAAVLWHALALPADLGGLSVADIGASNGYFSFEARRRGAQVTAFDFRHKDNSGFGLAQYINGMTDIAHHHVNVLNLRHADYGQFDIVLALGLLYHTADPYLALANCAGLAQDRLLVESYCIDSVLPRNLASEPIMRFLADPVRFPGQAQPNADRSNFWGFTSVCLRRMAEDIGFVVDRLVVAGDRVVLDARRGRGESGQTRLSLAYGAVPRKPVQGAPEDPEAWTIF
jgi:tRNA (mo5U34)-methyltransferase